MAPLECGTHNSKKMNDESRKCDPEPVGMNAEIEQLPTLTQATILKLPDALTEGQPLDVQIKEKLLQGDTETALTLYQQWLYIHGE